MCNTLTNNLMYNIFFSFASTMRDNEAYLTRLDEAIGDGDHGLNMALGFHKIQEQIQLMPPGTPDLLLRTAGMTLVTTISGASGPLYGAAFIAAGMEAQGKSELSLVDLARMVHAAEVALARR